MPRITSIKPQKDQKRVNIYLDGRFGFGLDLENFVKLNLKVEQELAPEEIEEITKKASFAKYLNRLLNFAMVRPRSEKEILDWFKRKKVEETYFKKLLSKLKKFELLDDEKFASWWVQQRLTFKAKSKKELLQELRIKGIDKDIVEKVLSESNLDEEKNAKKLLEKNLYKWKRFDKETAKKKAGEFLLRKGFSWDMIKKVLK